MSIFTFAEKYVSFLFSFKWLNNERYNLGKSVSYAAKAAVILTILFLASFCHHSDGSPTPPKTTTQDSGLSSQTTTAYESSQSNTDETFTVTDSSTISHSGDIVPPTWEIDSYVGNITFQRFDVFFSLNEVGILYYSVMKTVVASPPSVEDLKTMNQTFNVETEQTELFLTITQENDASKIMPDTEYTIFLLAEDLSENAQQEAMELSVKTEAYPYLEWYRNYPNIDIPESDSVDVYYKFKEKDAVLYYALDPCDESSKNCVDPITLPEPSVIKQIALDAEVPQTVNTKADLAASLQLSPLIELTRYILYLVGEDEHGILQPSVAYIVFETQPKTSYSNIIISYIFQSSGQWGYNCCPNEADISDYDVNAHMRFIELRNVSDMDVNIGGWSLQFYHNLIDNDTYEPDKVEMIAFPTDTVISAKKSFLIGTDNVHDILTPDMNLVNYGYPLGIQADLLNDTGKGIALAREIIPATDRDDTEIEDQMGYIMESATFPYFGEGDLGYVEKTSDGCGANFRRKNYGLRDTNNTAVDWEMICESTFVPPMNGSSISFVEPPQVISSYPIEGSSYDSEVLSDTFTIEFNEDMNFAYGYVEIVGGTDALRPVENFYQIAPSFSIDNQRWTSPRTYSFDLIGLNSDTHYQFELKDFRDLQNSLLSAENGEADQPYLKDLYLDVFTQPAIHPTVSYAFPVDDPALDCAGSIPCVDRTYPYIQIQFSETMNIESGTATVSLGSAEIPTYGAYWWNTKGDVFMVSITGLAENENYQFSLSGFKDIFGYEAEYSNVNGVLGDNGFLDFRTKPTVFDERLQITQVYLPGNGSSTDYYNQYLEIWNNTSSEIDWDTGGHQYFLGLLRLMHEGGFETYHPATNPLGRASNWNERYYGYTIQKLEKGFIQSSATTQTIQDCWRRKARTNGPPTTPAPGCPDGSLDCIIAFCAANPTKWYCTTGCGTQELDTWVLAGTGITNRDQAIPLLYESMKGSWNGDYDRSKGGAVVLFQCDTCLITDLQARHNSSKITFPEIPINQWDQFPRDTILKNGPTEFSTTIMDVVLIYGYSYSQSAMGYHGVWWWDRNGEDTFIYAFDEYRKIFGASEVYGGSAMQRISPYAFVGVAAYPYTDDVARFPDLP